MHTMTPPVLTKEEYNETFVTGNIRKVIVAKIITGDMFDCAKCYVACVSTSKLNLSNHQIFIDHQN